MSSFGKFGFLISLLLAAHLATAQRDAWIATWTASPTGAEPDASEPLLRIGNQTVRERVRVSIGGSQIRLRLFNEYGFSSLFLGSVTVEAVSGV